jgi:hypothetical protein
MSSADKMQAGGNLSVNPGGRLADEWPARGRRSGMSFADFAFVQVVQGTTITSNKKKSFVRKEQAYWQQDLAGGGLIHSALRW